MTIYELFMSTRKRDKQDIMIDACRKTGATGQERQPWQQTSTTAAARLGSSDGILTRCSGGPREQQHHSPSDAVSGALQHAYVISTFLTSLVKLPAMYLLLQNLNIDGNEQWENQVSTSCQTKFN